MMKLKIDVFLVSSLPWILRLGLLLSHLDFEDPDLKFAFVKIQKPDKLFGKIHLQRCKFFWRTKLLRYEK